MRIKLTYIAPLLRRVLLRQRSPLHQRCGSKWQTCSGNICQSPGNVQVNNVPPPVQYHPYGDVPFLLAATVAFTVAWTDT